MSVEVTREGCVAPNGEEFEVDIIRASNSPAPIVVCDGPGIKCPFRGIYHSSIPTCRVEVKSHKGIMICGKVSEPD